MQVNTFPRRQRGSVSEVLLCVLQFCATKWDLSDLKFHLNDFTLTHCTVHLTPTLNIKQFEDLYI